MTGTFPVPSPRRTLAPAAAPAAAVLLAALVALGGCAAVPAVDGPTLSVAEVRAAQAARAARADRPGRPNAATADGRAADDGSADAGDGAASPPAATTDPAAVAADELAVRWGGTIAEVRNTAAGTTVLEIVSRPLRAGGRPRGGDVTDGRFLAEVDAFLDPAVFKVGRDVTVTGRVSGQRDGTIGETAYRFPVVDVEDYHYWQPQTAQRHFPHPMPLGDPHHDFFHGWPHSIHHHHHRRRGSYVGGSVTF